MGAIQVQFGTFSGDQRNLSKQLETPTTLSCEIYENCSIYEPRFILDYKPSYIGFNYCYVSAWNRYYFITGQDLQSAKRIIVRCHCDVLNSFGSQLRNSKFRVKRSEYRYDPYIPDNGYVYQDQYDVIHLLSSSNVSFPNGYLFGDQDDNSYCYVLGVNGNQNVHDSDVWGFVKIDTQPDDWATRYMFYWVNLGTARVHEMKTIGDLIYEEKITNAQGSDFNLMNTMYGVYQKKEFMNE